MTTYYSIDHLVQTACFVYLILFALFVGDPINTVNDQRLSLFAIFPYTIILYNRILPILNAIALFNEIGYKFIIIICSIYHIIGAYFVISIVFFLFNNENFTDIGLKSIYFQYIKIFSLVHLNLTYIRTSNYIKLDMTDIILKKFNYHDSNDD